jgi:hypothetical protein
MIEMVVAPLPVSMETPWERRSTGRATLIRSACETLARTSPAVIAALTVSLPASEPAQTNRLQEMARWLAAEYEFDAAVAVEESHISVRFSRRQGCGGRE